MRIGRSLVTIATVRRAPELPQLSVYRSLSHRLTAFHWVASFSKQTDYFDDILTAKYAGSNRTGGGSWTVRRKMGGVGQVWSSGQAPSPFSRVSLFLVEGVLY